MSASFALNTIPTATLTVAVGYNPLENNKPATIHTILPQIKPRQRVIVELTINKGGGDVTRLAAGKYIIFDGFLAGIGIQRAYNQFNYVLNLVHWLDDLNNSSMIAGNWFPGVPDDYTAAAAIETFGSTGANQNVTIAAAASIASEIFTDQNISEDLWGLGIKKMFTAMAEGPKGLTDDEAGEIKNDAALAALERMPGTAPNAPKLGFSTGDSLQDAISQYFSATIKSSSGQTSFWGKLISDYCPQFCFAISPATDWATPIPFCPGLRWKRGGKEISIKDYNYSNFNANMSQIIESVNILWPLTTQNGVQFELPTLPPGRVAYYAPAAQWPEPDVADADSKRGLRLFKTPPTWFAQLGAADVGALLSTGDARTVAAPGVPPAGLGPPTGAEAANKNKTVVDNFAKQWFINEVLQQRYGEISGPLRFDIAPGSIVKIELPPSSPGATSNEYVVASVISVSYVINAERAMSGTTFTLAHTKTKDENDDTDTDFVADAPPLYPASSWAGGPLAEPLAEPGPLDGVGDVNPNIPGQV